MNELDAAREAQEEINRANEASQIINNPVYIHAITIMKADAVGLFEKSKQSDSKAHKEAWLQLNAIKDFEENLLYIMENGVMARENLTFMKKASKLVGL